MYLKLLKNDFRKNPWNNGILLLFICLSVTIVATVTLMLAQLFASISSMYETANPPHFVQMHKGELSQQDLDGFNSDYEGIEHWQTVSMINLYGDEITASDESGKKISLSDCRLDIGFVKQNQKYDVLLDGDRNPLTMGPGEIGVPVILLDEFAIAVGDTITLDSGTITKDFTVADYVYDGQMNSTLCSSTRFLISDTDFEALSGSVGETEYLIEAWLSDSAQGAAYQTAYEQNERNLPKNGQAVTYTIIFLLSAMTDLLTAAVFVLAGVLLLIIALVCLRYVVLTELEEDMCEIGTMKAMGIPEKGICGLYLNKIRILTMIGCVLGFLFAQACVSMLTEHMNRTFGGQTAAAEGLLLSATSVVAVYGIILAFSRKILSRLKKAAVTDLLVTGEGFGRRVKAKDGLRKKERLPVNLLIGLHEVRRGYGIIFGVLLLISFLIAVPFRTVQTMEDREFVTYMGSPVYDLLLEVEQGEDLEERSQLAKDLLLEGTWRDEIRGVSTLRRVRLQAVRKDGKMAGIYIDTGENAGAGLKYLIGKNPESDAEIALSYLMGEELGKTVGDTVDIIVSGKRQELTVCGVYQDMTSGGRTAKTVSTFPEAPAQKYSYGLTLPGGDPERLASGLREQLGGGYSVENMEEFLRQTLGGVTAQVRQAGIAVLLLGICLAALIAALFLKLRIAREAASLASKKAMGIPFTAIRKQEVYPALIAGGCGSACGILLTELMGEHLISGLSGMLGMGIQKIIFVPAPAWELFAIPALLLVVLSIVAVSICTQIKYMDVAGYINE